jgi:hypothetical protein
MNKEERQEFIIGSILGAAVIITCKSSHFFLVGVKEYLPSRLATKERILFTEIM